MAKAPKASKAGKFSESTLVPIGAEAYEDLFITEGQDYDFENCDTRADAIGPYDKRDVVAAIIFTRGIWSAMARLLGRNRSRVRDYVLKHADVAAIHAEVQEIALDDLESGVLINALLGDSTDRRFLLQTLGKNRGYSTRHELTGKEGVPLSVSIDVSKLSSKELRAIKGAVVES